MDIVRLPTKYGDLARELAEQECGIVDHWSIFLRQLVENAEDADREILSIRQQVGKLEAALQVLSTLEPQAAFHDGWGVAHEANRIARAALEAD